MGWRGIPMLLLTALGVGCAAQGQHAEFQAATPVAARGSAYGDLLADHTRKVELFEGLDLMALGWATWETADLRRALAAERGADEVAAEPPDDGELRFHVALYTRDRKWNELDAAGSFWLPYLEGPEGQRVAPLRVTSRRKTGKAEVEFPYVTAWTREYELVFPGGFAPEPPTLVLNGPLGSLRFRF